MVSWSQLLQQKQADLGRDVEENGGSSESIDSIDDREQIDADADEDHGSSAFVTENGRTLRSIAKTAVIGSVGLVFAGSAFWSGFVLNAAVQRSGNSPAAIGADEQTTLLEDPSYSPTYVPSVEDPSYSPTYVPSVIAEAAVTPSPSADPSPEPTPGSTPEPSYSPTYVPSVIAEADVIMPLFGEELMTLEDIGLCMSMSMMSIDYGGRRGGRRGSKGCKSSKKGKGKGGKGKGGKGKRGKSCKSSKKGKGKGGKGKGGKGKGGKGRCC